MKGSPTETGEKKFGKYILLERCEESTGEGALKCSAND